jgi:hypothetical protein
MVKLRNIRTSSVCAQQSIGKRHSVALHQLFALGDQTVALCADRFVSDVGARHEGRERKFGFSHHAVPFSGNPHSLVAEHSDDLEFAAECLDHSRIRSIR